MDRHRCYGVSFLVTLIFWTKLAYGQEGLSSIGPPTATATFESIGIILPFRGDDNKDSSCRVEYRQEGETIWHPGLDLWVDHRTERRDSREFRGSLVHLEPATRYQIRLHFDDPDGGSGSVSLEASTWSEFFDVAETEEVYSRSTPLVITESGTPTGYRLYQSPAGQTSTIDVDNNHDNCVTISASYVIIRGLNLRGARRHAIQMDPGVHDVVVDGCDISNWGPAGIGSLQGFDLREASGIYVQNDSERIVVQNNVIHHPRGGANSWIEGPEPWQDGTHPRGPQAISFMSTAGNHVIRYNHCYSEGLDHYFNDVIGGEKNEKEGNLKCDSDVYGNIVSHAWDDGLEIEGFNINVRIWGNIIHNTMKGIATANIGYHIPQIDNSIGPHYIWRNFIFDATEPYRSATKIRGNGGYYFFHNTIINAGLAVEAPREDVNTDISDVQNVGLVKNNIFLSGTFRRSDDAISAAAWWDFDYNLYPDSRGAVDPLRSDWELHGVFGETPVFDIEGQYTFYLAPDDPGVDAAGPIPNFNDQYSGLGPDMGAFERGAFPPSAMVCIFRDDFQSGNTEAWSAVVGLP